MAKIKLNDRGAKTYPHLIDTPLTVYGYDSKYQCFICWDWICGKWIEISNISCEAWEEEK